MDLNKEHEICFKICMKQPFDRRMARVQMDRLAVLIKKGDPSEYIVEIKCLCRSGVIDAFVDITNLLRLAKREREINNDVLVAYLLFVKLPQNLQDVLQCMFREYIGVRWKHWDDGWMENLDLV